MRHSRQHVRTQTPRAVQKEDWEAVKGDVGEQRRRTWTSMNRGEGGAGGKQHGNKPQQPHLAIVPIFLFEGKKGKFARKWGLESSTTRRGN